MCGAFFILFTRHFPDNGSSGKHAIYVTNSQYYVMLQFP